MKKLALEESNLTPMDRAFAKVQPATDQIWGSLASLGKGGRTARVLFCGVEPQAGTTLIAGATALGLARNLRQSVNLIETDVARPALAGYLGLSDDRGLTEVLAGELELAQAARPLASCPELTLLPAGSARRAIAGELACERAQAVFEELTSSARFCLIDAPPILGRPETRLLLDWADAAVLVLRARATRRDQTQRALRVLEEHGVEVLGSVLNRFKSELPF